MADELINFDIFAGATAGATFDAPNDTITVVANFIVNSTNNVGVDSDFANNTLINSGTVHSGGSSGAQFSAANGRITNNAPGDIIGGANGILFDTGGGTVINRGLIQGLSQVGVLFGANFENNLVDNDGQIIGRDTGIRLLGSTIVNEGDIIATNGRAIDIGGGSFNTTVINNKVGGLIRGAIAITNGDNCNVKLTNAGTITGVVDLNATGMGINDTVRNSGKMGAVNLGAGADTFIGTNGRSGTVSGEVGSDTLIGGAFADVLSGGAGIDTLRGGKGRDSLNGGTERDLFDFNSVAEAGKGSSRDVIQSFTHGNNTTGDDIDLRDIDAKTGIAGNNAFNFIGQQAFHDVKGELRFTDQGTQCLVQGDTNGDGAADFELLVKVGSLAAGDFLL